MTSAVLHEEVPVRAALSFRGGAGLGLVVPLLVLMVVAFDLPFVGMLLRSFSPPQFSFDAYREVVTSDIYAKVLFNTFRIAGLAALFCALLGYPLAYWMRGLSPGAQLAALALVIVPIAFAKLGFLGSLTCLIIGHTVLAAAYVVLVVSVALAGFGHRIEQIAATLGAPWHTILLRVVAPNMLPSLFAAWIFAFIVSFDEITVTVFLAGAHETVPKRMFTQLMERVDPTITAVATLLIAVSLLTALAVALLMGRAGLLTRIRADR